MVKLSGGTQFFSGRGGPPPPVSVTDIVPAAARAPVDVPASPDMLPQSIIGKDLQLRGKDIQVVVEGRLRIDGQVSGEVYGHEVVIGPEARINGRVVSKRMQIDGAIESGEIFAYDVVLNAGARVNADIHHTTLKVVDGAQFEGRARRIAADGLLPGPEDPHGDGADRAAN